MSQNRKGKKGKKAQCRPRQQKSYRKKREGKLTQSPNKNMTKARHTNTLHHTPSMQFPTHLANPPINSVHFISIPFFLLIQQIDPLILILPIPPLEGNEGNLNLLCQTRPQGTNTLILTNLLPSQVFKFWTCRPVYIIYPASPSALALPTCSSWVLG